mgnify:CR=1 FL=1
MPQIPPLQPSEPDCSQWPMADTGHAADPTDFDAPTPRPSLSSADHPNGAMPRSSAQDPPSDATGASGAPSAKPFADIPTPVSRRLEFFPVALAAYRHQPAWDLKDAQTEIEHLAALLRDFGAVPVPWDTPMAERGADAINARMRHWARPTPGTPADTFLYWVGHGRSDGRRAVLAHTDTPPDFTDAVIRPEQMAEWIRNRAARTEEDGTWAVVVVEACRSGDFVRLVSAELDSDLRVRPRTLLVGVTGSGTSSGATNLGVFRRELRNVLHNDFGASPVVPLADLADALKSRLGEATVRPLDLPESAALHRRTFTPVGVTVDAADEIAELLRALPDAERLHFVPKAQGAELGEVAWFFQGRAKERRRICDWLRSGEDGLFVVTGAPGTGKSALLGHLVVTSRPRLRTALTARGHLPELSQADRPPDHAFDAVLHLTGATLEDVVRDIARAAGVADLAADAPAHKLIEQLLSRIGDMNGSLTVLVDALDEARQPVVIARSLLRPLAELPGVRLIVGTRASTMEGPDHTGPAIPDLLNALDPAEGRLLTVTADRFAIHPYVARRLRHLLNDDPRYSAGIDRAALLIADGEHEFLFARLAVHELQARRDLLVPGREDDLDAFLACSHRDLFARAVERHRAVDPRRVPLLEALGLAQGRGLPIVDGVWAAVAEALADVGTPPITGRDIDELIEAAAPYLVRDTEHGQTVYRLAHATFAEHFTNSETPDGDERHRRITTRLIRAIAHDRNGAATTVNPYLRHNLPGHAARGGLTAWRELAAHPRVLDELDPGRVAAEVMTHAFGRYPLPAEIAGVVGMRHLLDGLPPAQRIGVRQLGSARHANATRPAATDLPRPDTAWSLRWAKVTRHVLHLTLADHGGPVHTLAVFPGPDGNALLAACNLHGTVWIWDPTTASALAVLISHPGEVQEMTAFPGPGGHALLATGGRDGTIRIWDVATGTTQAVLAGRADEVWAMAAFPGPHGRPLLATGGRDGTVRIWDVATGTTQAVLASKVWVVAEGISLLTSGDWRDSMIEIWDAATGTTKTVLAGCAHSGRPAMSAFPGPAGRTLLATGGGHGSSMNAMDETGQTLHRIAAEHSGWARVWDAVSGTTHTVLTGGTGRVEAVAAFPGPDGRPLLATGGRDGTVRIWDATTGITQAELTGHTDEVWAMAAFPGPDGRPLLATGGRDGTVRIWDATTGITQAELTGHTLEVRAMAAFPGPDGRPLLATGGLEGIVRIWDVATGTTKMELYRHHSWVEAMTAFTGLGGHILLATSSLDSTVRIWNATTGTTQALLTGYIGSAWAMAALLGPDGRSLLATCDEFDRTVRVWDVATWSLLHVLRVDMAVYGLAPVEAGLAVAGSEGIVVVDLHPGLVTAR